MEFSVNELTDKSLKYFEITNNPNCLRQLKEVESDFNLKIDFETLNLGQKLFRATKKENRQKSC